MKVMLRKRGMMAIVPVLVLLMAGSGSTESRASHTWSGVAVTDSVAGCWFIGGCQPPPPPPQPCPGIVPTTYPPCPAAYIRTEQYRGHTALPVDLKFVCSPWLYTRAPKDPSMSIDGKNAQMCADIAARQVIAAQKIFDDSQIPIVLNYHLVFLPHAVGPLLGTNGMSKADRIAAVNNAPGRMPGYLLTDADIRTISVPGPTHREADLASCSPFAPPNCGNPNSTQRVSNFRWRWGADSGSVGCGVWTCPANRRYERSSTGLGTDCHQDCRCSHNANNQTEWNLLACSSVYGAWPGLSHSVERNSCGCIVRDVAGAPVTQFQSTPDTPWLVPGRQESYLSILAWIKASSYRPKSFLESNASGPQTFAVTVAIAPLYELQLNLTAIRGKAAGVYNVDTQILFPASGIPGPVSDRYTDSNYLHRDNFSARLGQLVIWADSDIFTLTHELGHVFGAMHDRPSMRAAVPGDYDAFGLANWSNFAYLSPATGTRPAFGTVMAADDSLEFGYFSTPAFKAVDLTIGDKQANNRRQIMKTLIWLTPTGVTDWVVDPP